MSDQEIELWKREKFLLLSWEALGQCLDRIKAKIDEEGFVPTTIIGISRGGLVLAAYLANRYGLRDLQVMSIIRNTSEQKYSPRGAPVLQWMTEVESLAGKNVLVADDIAGDGGTLTFALDILRAKNPAAIRTAVVVKNENTRVEPDYHAVEVGDWIVFPWEPPADRSASTEPIRL